jgi:hypothetical protein
MVTFSGLKMDEGVFLSRYRADPLRDLDNGANLLNPRLAIGTSFAADEAIKTSQLKRKNLKGCKIFKE